MIAILKDERGSLSWTTEPRWVRAYWITDPNPCTIRGEHAHKEATRLLTCLVGSVRLTTENATGSCTYTLIFGLAVHIPPMTWTRLHDFAPGSVVLGLADRPYDPGEIHGDKSEWLSAVSALRQAGAAR